MVGDICGGAGTIKRRYSANYALSTGGTHVL
jgi:hypothetical protein